MLKEVTDLGHPISSVARLEVGALESLVTDSLGGTNDARAAPAPLGRVCESYLGAVTRLDTARSMQILRTAASRLDPHDFVFTVALPIIQEVGRRWSHGDLGVAQEHVVSAQMASLLGSVAAAAVQPSSPRLLVTTPPGHRHEFGALVAGILAALRRFDPVYLGPDLPWSELDWAIQMSRPEVLVLSVVRDVNPAEIEALEENLQRLEARLPVWLGCPAEHALTRRAGPARLFHSYAQFDAALRELRGTRNTAS